MRDHPDYYTQLLQRQLDGDPRLTPRERRELDLHLLVCPLCNYHYAIWLQAHDPRLSRQMLHDLWAALTPSVLAPYLEELAEALRSPEPLPGFYQLLWEAVRCDPETLIRLQLLQVCADQSKY